MRVRVFVVFLGLVLLVSACSSADPAEDASGANASETAATTADITVPTGSPSTTASTATVPSTGDSVPPSASTTAGGTASPQAGGSRTATVTLDNGEEFTFAVQCGLEPQESAGLDILFTAVSNDEPYGFDVTQFGSAEDDASALALQGAITIWDAASYDDVWAANTLIAELSGTDYAVQLDGTTIKGSALFVPEGDIERIDEGVPGELIVDCS